MTETKTVIEQCREIATKAFYTVAPANVGFNARLIMDDLLTFTWRFDVDKKQFAESRSMVFSPNEPTTAMQRAQHIGLLLGRTAAYSMQQAYTQKYFPL